MSRQIFSVYRWPGLLQFVWTRGQVALSHRWPFVTVLYVWPWRIRVERRAE